MRAADGSDVDGTRVTVVHAATGFAVRTEVRHGRFLVQGLEVGGPYTVTLERLGLAPQKREGVHLSLGEPLDLGFVLEPAAIPLEAVDVVGRTPLPQANVHGGTATTVPDSLLHRLPTLNRNLYDFVPLAPQLSTRIGFGPQGMSGGGVGFRFNNFLVNGVPHRSAGSNQPPEFAGGRSLPFEAVSEYQVLLAPFDVRYGTFAGALVNAVTRSGTNALEGSVFAYGRTDALARRGALAAAEPHERLQYGFRVGGPLWRDRAHFFLASELQRHVSPAPGPFVGQSDAASPPVPVAEADLRRLEDLLAARGLAAGSGGPVRNRNPLTNVFGRLDVGVPERNSRVVLWLNEARARNPVFSRPDRGPFPLSTHQTTLAFDVRSAALQLHSALPRAGGGHNELLMSHQRTRGEHLPAVRQPVVGVRVPGTTGGTVMVLTGTPSQAQGPPVRLTTTNLRNDLTLPVGASHVVTFGFEAEWFRVEHSGLLNTFGTWTFSSLDSLEAGLAERFEVARDFGSANVPIKGGQYALFAGNRWRAGDRVTVTAGLRAEVLATKGRAPYNPVVDSVFGRRTDERPPRRIHLSPRLGFTWEVGATGRDQLRGGAGVFTGRPPLAWLRSPLSNYGVGTGVLRCGSRVGDLGPPPPFETDPGGPPGTCGDGSGLEVPPLGDVELLHRRLRMTQTLRGVLAYDRRLPWELVGTLEALLTRNVSDFAFVNLNLGEPRGVDSRGRILYGTIDTAGVAVPPARDHTFPSVIELVKVSGNRSYQFSGRLERRFSRGLAASASYTYSRVRDVQTPLRINVPGSVNWASRAVSGRHDDLRPGVSRNDVPHRVVLAGTYRSPWGRWPTELSFYYVGESGSPFTYLAWGVGGRGDLNADGSSQNDPIYVPRSALDPDEILFSGRSDEPGADNSPAARATRVRAQQMAFEAFIQGSRCLRRQRGRITERNSCREPWSHTTAASLRQPFPLAGRTFEIQLDVFNVLNLLRGGWGHRRVADPQLLEHVGQATDSAGESRPIFRFEETRARWQVAAAESAFQLQLALRYRF